MGRLRSPHAVQILVLLGILAVAGFLRLYGMNWDDGHYLHPDERFIATVSADRVNFPGGGRLGSIFDPTTSPLNPRRDDESGNPLSFAYGTLPLYAQGIASSFLNLSSERDWGGYRELYKVGRPLTALVDLVTVALVFLLGRRLFAPAAGLIAAAFYALAVLPIQLSHFFTVDVWLTCFVTATLYLLIRFLDQPSLGRSAAVGAVIGCAFATKASVASLLLPVLAVYGYLLWTRRDQRRSIFGFAAIGGLVSLVAFTLGEPYALARSGPFFEDIRTQARIVSGEFDIPFTRQFVGLTPGVYELENMFRYTLGPALTVLAIVSVLVMVYRAVSSRDLALAVPLLWVLGYLPVLLLTEARFLRYSLPLVPVFAVLGGGLLWLGLRQAGWRFRLAQLATVACLSLTLVWAFGFTSIYGREHPRVAASQWMYANIPPGSTITGEGWDDALPLPLDGYPRNPYPIVSLDIYGDAAPEQKVRYLYDTLSDADYIVMSSDRLVGSVDNLPWRYAVQNQFYERLAQGQLGYQLVYDGTLQPELFGLRYDDLAADESFTVYDHPRVRIFEKVEQLSWSAWRDRFLWSINQPWEPTRSPSQQWLLLNQPVAAIETSNASQPAWPVGERTAVGIIVWLLVVEVVGLAALPLSALALGRSPDRGALSTRLLGLLLVGWFAWIGPSLGLWPGTRVSLFVVLAVLGLTVWLGYVWLRSRGRRVPLPSPRSYALSAVPYLSIFGLFLLFRAIYPDFWQTYFGGEKPFELAYLRAITDSVDYPPYDPWYAGGAINYYYFGWHLVAVLVRLSGVGVSLGFQLATATLPALFGCQVIALAMSLRGRRVSRHPTVIRGVVAAGALALVATLLAGNLDALRQVWSARGSTDSQFDFWASTRVIDYTINEFPYFSYLWADVHPHVVSMAVVVLLATLLSQFILSASSQNVMSTRALGSDPRTLAMLSLMPLVLGSIFVTNAWDAPLMVGLVVAAFVYAGALRGWRSALAFGGIGLVVTALSFVLYWPFFANFYSVAEGVALAERGSPLDQFLTVWGIFFAIVACFLVVRLWQARGDLGLDDGLLAATLVLAVSGVSALVSATRTAEFSIASYLVSLALVVTVVVATALVTRPFRLSLPQMSVIVVLIALSAAFTAYRPAGALALAFCVAGASFASRAWRSPAHFLPWAFVAVGSLTIAATEVVYVVDDLQAGEWQRMNTVFKFSLPTWILLAVGSSLLLTRLWSTTGLFSQSRSSPSTRFGFVAQPMETERASFAGRRIRLVPVTFASIATLVLVGGLAYPVFATPVRLSQDMPTTPRALTLDGYAWMRGGSILNATGQPLGFTGDLEAIEWLDQNVEGTPVLLEASIGPYRANGSRISSATGLPAVLGWDRHQYQQRYSDGIARRMREVREIYNETNPWRKLELLRGYDVRYVIVGDIERYWDSTSDSLPYASPEGLAAFEKLVADGAARVAFSAHGTTVYEILDFPSLPAAPDAVRRS